MLAVRRTPEINAVWDEADARRSCYKHYVNLGIAAATPRGLVVPNIKDADRLSLLELAEALGELTATAREGKTQPAEMSGGTFTITNVGRVRRRRRHADHQPRRVRDPVLRRGPRQPWVVDGRGRRPPGDHARAVLRPPASSTASRARRFLADVARVLEDPATALLW